MHSYEMSSPSLTYDKRDNPGALSNHRHMAPGAMAQASGRALGVSVAACFKVLVWKPPGRREASGTPRRAGESIGPCLAGPAGLVGCEKGREQQDPQPKAQPNPPVSWGPSPVGSPGSTLWRTLILQ